ncbi:MAG: choice-of-anchor tandem repeat GloVer-containing protein [Terriglobales bacterium]|jgi:uncharacterized repeat protein (TIGR03803 family)
MTTRPSAAGLKGTGWPAGWCLFWGAVLWASAGANAQVQFQIVHAFGATGDANAIYSQVALDAKGNLYGTGAGGAAYNSGAVFELSPNGDGSWNEGVLHSFGAPGDGAYPYGPVTLGAGGVLYGATSGGGTNRQGVIYSLTLVPTGWSESVLHRLVPADQVSSPSGNIVQDAAGNLYGEGGIFELSAGTDGWAFTLICERRDICSAGIYDDTVLAPGVRLFSTGVGGEYRLGNVYVNMPAPGGWKTQTLFSFGGTQYDGQIPSHGPLVADATGSIYGTTFQGGSYICENAGCGTIYKLTRQAGKGWQEAILYSFRPPSTGTGYNPTAGVIIDKAGNLYGTAAYGGAACGCGVVYRLTHNRNDTWTYTVLHRFVNSDGALPYSSLIFDTHGNLLGTTVGGGPYGGGVVFELSRANSEVGLGD